MRRPLVVSVFLTDTLSVEGPELLAQLGLQVSQHLCG